jgi:PAP2 superfamily
MKRHATTLCAAIAAACLAATSASAGNIVTDWTQIASTTIVKNGGKSPGASSVWFAYASIAAYDAVNAITGQYRPFYYQGSGPANASVDAAVLAASHRVLVNYFPAQKDSLDTSFNSFMAGLAGDPSARDAGVTVGEAAAAALIAARTGDGLEANISYTPGSGPGAWVPTPPAFAAPVTPWLGQMRPFTMSTPGDFLPDGPTPLSSEAWKRDYTLTRLLGGATSTIRLASETEIGVFWTEQTAQQYARSFTYLVNNYSLSVPESARLLAMLWTGYADAAIGCFNAKYKYGFWRPVTAIPAGGGNPDLSADPSWLALGATPAHPEYPAAHACITASVSTITAGYFGTTRVHIVTDSTVFTDGLHTHTFEDTRDWIDEVFWARIYAGFHFHHSLEDGRALGEAVGRELLQNHFRKTVPAP